MESKKIRRTIRVGNLIRRNFMKNVILRINAMVNGVFQKYVLFGKHDKKTIFFDEMHT